MAAESSEARRRSAAMECPRQPSSSPSLPPPLPVLLPGV